GPRTKSGRWASGRAGVNAGHWGGGGRPPAGPHFPGRAVTGDRVLLIARHRFLAHPGEEIVRMIVFAHVIEAEAPILVLMPPPLRRAMGGSVAAAGPFARGRCSPPAPVLIRLDADAIVNGRIEFHDRPLCGIPRRPRKIDKIGFV